MHVGVFLIQSAFFIHLVCRCASLNESFQRSTIVLLFPPTSTVLLDINDRVCFCRAILCISAAYTIMQCLSVCLSVCPSVRPSVTFLDCVKTKHIFKIFASSGSQAILVFPHPPNSTAISRPNGGVECRWVGRNHDSEPISGFTACCGKSET